MKNDLTAFLSGGVAPLAILLVESTPYLPRVRRLYPSARIQVVTDIPEVADTPEYRGLADGWHGLDYRLGELPFDEESFDLILAEGALTDAYEVYRLLLGLNRLLKETGALLTSFRNIRYHQVLDYLQQGEFPIQQEHYYAKAEVVRLAERALFQELHFLPGEQDEEQSAGEAWAARGFGDYSHDLSTRVWLLRAERSTAEAAALKSIFTPATRKELARLLHRIEYDVQRGEAVKELCALCEREGIFFEYLADFVRNTCHHSERVLQALRGFL